MQRLETIAAQGLMAPDGIPRLDAIAAVTAIDYLDFRFAGEPWVPSPTHLAAVSLRLRDRRSFAETMPYTPG
jgi:hypothetical protein